MIRINTHGPVTEWNYTSGSRLMNMVLSPFWATVYIIDGLMIDTGSPSSLHELSDFIKSPDVDKKIKQAIITHWHEDHTGGARLLTDRFGIEVLASKATAEKIQVGYKIPFYRKVAWGKRVEAAPKIKEFSEQTITTPGGKFHFHVMEVPGHANGQFILIEKNHGLVFTGDAVMPAYRMLFGHRCDIQEDIRDIYISIKLLLKEIDEANRPFTLFMSGNGIKEDCSSFLKDKIMEIEIIHEKVHSLKDQGRKEKEILKEMFGKETPAAIISRGAFSRMNLVRSLLKWEEN